MNHNFLSSPTLNLKTIIFFLTVETALSVNPQFISCSKPSNCGNNINISYPFWIQDKQQSYCGYPGFGLSCKNLQPILNLSGKDYIIREIFYNNQSFRLANNIDWNSSDSCPYSSLHNLTIDTSLYKSFPNQSELIFFFNCNASLIPNDFPDYSIGCSSDNSTRRSLALFGDDGNLSYVKKSGNCETPVMAVIDNNGGNASFEKMLYRDRISGLLNKGFLLRWNARNCSVCEESGGRCGYDFEAFSFVCFCPHRPHLKRCHGPNTTIITRDEKSNNVGKKLGIGTGIVGFFIVIAVIILCYLRRKHSSNNSMKKTKNGLNVEAFLKNQGTVALKRYNYSDVKKMTNSFKEKLGQGGYGGVFKGKLLDGRMVAVKVLSETKGNGEEFINEVASISRTSHVNIVTLLGFCIEGLKRALIYEFMSNGSLEKFIYEDNVVNKHPHLGWEMLYKIAIGIARGLEYLHRGCNTRILHFDIKPHNILLDQDFCPKISDFGLAKLCLVKDSIVSMTGARGTPGYIAPELVSINFGGVSHKSDVYSYGMMVLEMVGGRKNMDLGASNSSKIYFPLWIYRRIDLGEDLGLHGITSMEDEIAKKMILVGLWCIQINPLNRPPMNRVLEMLEKNLADIQIPPTPFMSSPSREQEPCSSREEECSSSTWQPL